MPATTLLVGLSAFALAQDPTLDRPDHEILAAGRTVVPHLIERLSLREDDSESTRARDARILLLLGALGAGAAAAVPRLHDGHASLRETKPVAAWLPELEWAVGELSAYAAEPWELPLPPRRPRGDHLWPLEFIVYGKLQLGRQPTPAALLAGLESTDRTAVVSAAARARDTSDAKPELLTRLRDLFWTAWFDRGDATPNWYALESWLLVESARSLLALEPGTAGSAFLHAAQLRHPSVIARRAAARALLDYREHLPALLPELLAGLADPDPEVATAIAQAISLGADELAPLTRALHDRRATAGGELAATLDRALARVRAARDRPRPSARDDLLAAWFDRRVDQSALDTLVAGRMELGDTLVLIEVMPLASAAQHEQILAALTDLPADLASRCGLPARLRGMRGKATVMADPLAEAIARHTVRSDADEPRLRDALLDPSPAVQLRALTTLATRQACAPETERTAAQVFEALQTPATRSEPRKHAESERQFERTLAAARLVTRAGSLPGPVRQRAALVLLRDGDREAQRAGLEAFRTLDDVAPAIEYAVGLLRSPHDDLTLGAIAVLARADARVAREPLAQLAAGEGELAQAATAALGQLREPEPATGEATPPPAPQPPRTEFRAADPRRSIAKVLGGRAIDVMFHDSYRALWNTSVDLSEPEEALRQLGALQDEHGVFCFGGQPAVPVPMAGEPTERLVDVVGEPLVKAMALIATTAKLPFAIGQGITGDLHAVVDMRDCRRALRAIAPADVLVGERDGVLLVVKRTAPDRRTPWQFLDVDATTALTTIAGTGGARLQIDPHVRGKVTLRATGLHWRDALAVAARSVGAELIARNDGSFRIAPQGALTEPAAGTIAGVSIGGICQRFTHLPGLLRAFPLTLTAPDLEDVETPYGNLPMGTDHVPLARFLAAVVGVDMVESDTGAEWRRRRRD